MSTKMKWFQYKIHTTTKDADLIGDILCELGITGFEISDHVPLTPEEERQMYTDIPAPLPPDDGAAVIIFYTECGEESERDFYSTGSSLRDETLTDAAPVSPQSLIQKIQDRIRETSEWFPVKMPAIEYSLQDDSDWKDAWKKHFQAFRAAEHIVIQPSWEDTPSFAVPGDTIIRIEPGSAFGTGTHETTQLCLAALQNHITKDTEILDVGCGSGILAISALLSGAKSAFCIDIDPSAVEITRQNAEENGIDSNRLQVRRANILQTDEKIEGIQTYDIVVANILADVIISLSRIVGRYLRKDGILIASGILTEKAEEVRGALRQQKFALVDESTQGEWVCIIARKE